MASFVGTAWKGGTGRNGAGYGIKIDKKSRDNAFSRETKTVILQLFGETSIVEVNIDKPSFWNECRELIKKRIGLWLINSGAAPWPKGKPPKIKLTPTGKGKFLVEIL